MAPRFLLDQIQRSRRNLGLETIDYYLIQEPEIHLRELGTDGFRAALHATFEAMVAGIAKEFLERFDPAWERSWIAEVDGRRAGNIALVRRSKTVGQLRLLFVESWARGLGIGTRLVSECVGQARHVGYRKMVLFTVAGLDPARRLYEAEGFRLTEETPGHSWGKDHIAQTWELKL